MNPDNLTERELRDEEIAKLGVPSRPIKAGPARPIKAGPATRNISLKKWRIPVPILVLGGIFGFCWIVSLFQSPTPTPTRAPTTRVSTPRAESPAHAICKEFVKDRLEFPLQASFLSVPNYSNFNSINGMWYIRSHVTTRNAFGTRILDYECKVEQNRDGGWTLLSLRFAE